MNPSSMFCPNPKCPLSGQLGQQNIGVLSQKERRFQCLVCARTFSATTGTPFYRLRTDEATVTRVLALLGHG
jgi:transposase-like protein